VTGKAAAGSCLIRRLTAEVHSVIGLCQCDNDSNLVMRHCLTLIDLIDAESRSETLAFLGHTVERISYLPI
jgi:hypothetical protein